MKSVIELRKLRRDGYRELRDKLLMDSRRGLKPVEIAKLHDLSRQLVYYHLKSARRDAAKQQS